MMFASIGEDLLRAVLQGLPPGTVYALVALGFVLAYKTSGVFNLAFGAQAYVSAIAFYQLNTDRGWPILPSVLVSVFLLAPLLGVVLERLIFRHLRTAPPVAGLVVSIGLTVALPALAGQAFRYHPKGGARPEGIAPNGNNVFYAIGDIYSFSRNELVAIFVATAAALALGLLFKFSMLGLRMRAVVESPRMTELNGIPSDRVSMAAWALSSLFAGLAGVLIAPRFTALASGEYFNIVVIAIAAAAVGALVSLPRAYLGGLALGTVIALANTFIPKWSNDFTWLRPIQQNVTPAIPFLVLFGFIVLAPSVRRTRKASDPLAGVDPPPEAPAADVASSRGEVIRRFAGLGALGIAVVVLFARGDATWIYLVTQAVTLAIVYLSIVVITGLGGHISLAQGAYAAIGGWTTFQLADRFDVPVFGGMLLGAAIAAVVAALLAIPLLKLNGIWIAIATLAFAYFVDAVIVKFSWAGGTSDGSASQVVPRPLIGTWELTNDKHFLIVAFIILAIVTVAVTLFGRGTTGRKLAALRGSEVASQAIGISPARARVIVFAVSAFVAAIGGSMVAIHQKAVNYGSNFSPFAALFWLVLIVLFGARRPASALYGAAAFALMDKLVLQGTFLGWILRDFDRIPGFFPLSGDWKLILFGLGTINYAKHPEGVLAMQRAKREERRSKRAARAAVVPRIGGPVSEGAAG